MNRSKKRPPDSGAWVAGIDPDIDGSGLAMVDTTPARRLVLCNMRLYELASYLREAWRAGVLRCIAVEAGWLQGGNWHLPPRCSAFMASKIGRDIGRNHQTGIDLCEILDDMGVPYMLVRPLAKRWRKGKISHEELAMMMRGYTLPKRTNQEQRDAAELAVVQMMTNIKNADCAEMPPTDGPNEGIFAQTKK